MNSCNKKYPWLYTTNYWLGTINDNKIYYMGASGKLELYENNDKDYDIFLRPVIEVLTADINSSVQ